jgi:hypothetical protein
MLSTFLKNVKVSKKFIIVEQSNRKWTSNGCDDQKEQCGFKYIELKSYYIHVQFKRWKVAMTSFERQLFKQYK